MIWCLGRELNPHSLKDRGILSPLRLPVPPPRHEFYNLKIRQAYIIFEIHCQGFDGIRIKYL